MSVSRISSSAPTSTATWAARKSLSPKEISSVAVVSFSLITGSTRHSSSVVERLARVQVVGAGAHVEERQQHLRARARRARAAARRRRGRACPARPRWPPAARRSRSDAAQLHHAHAARDRAAGDDDHLARPRVRPPRAASQMPREHVHAQLAVAVRDDARAELDDDPSHARELICAVAERGLARLPRGRARR